MIDNKRKLMGARIIYYRNLTGWNQQELASRIGVTRQYLSKLEPRALLLQHGNHVSDSRSAKRRPGRFGQRKMEPGKIRHKEFTKR